MNLSTPVANITRVGKVTASKLKRLDIFTIQDLLFYFPWRYDDFSMSTPIAQLQPNTRANVVGTVEMLNNKKSFKRRLNITEALISDDSEMLKVVWFNQPFIARNLQVGDRVSLSGKVDSDHGLTVMTSPIYEKITQQVIHTQGLVPNYHLTSDLSQKQLRFLINQVIDLAQQVEDWLPETIRQEQRLLTLATAIQKIHFPKNQQDIDQAKARLSFDELFLLQLQSQITRQAIIRNKALPIKFLEPKTKELVKSLPFVLTDDQRKTAWEILQDLETDQPMTRLLEGDVGSGKTVVALLALYNTVLNGYQATIMVPTEVLAKQHFNSLNKLLSGFNINLALLTNSQQQTTNQEKITKAELGQQIANGQAQLIIGTHALIQQAVEFKNALHDGYTHSA
ncbi:MAG: ATP-dependent DNA helicase RecG [Candidatus Falkowbacteria bacterium GW2011_GWA2_39_24]|uniref:ATP-dependent DNA helicase RecG n=1 Tax=Candidatus Falkowbacteria bacterium GW2011_GWA2_39_24 TaxID=1618634 RepID=A0A0G0QWQ7_9BACT|nr:MAG: ATP-dependent DNA helicase RecG [Candidatus Falkowbacteria bacterium GW2011_GWA2_39_24]